MSTEHNQRGMIRSASACLCAVSCPPAPLALFVSCRLVDTLRSRGAHDTQYRRFVNEYEEYKAASEEIAEKLRTEVQLLYEYTEKLTHVMERIECGMCARRTKLITISFVHLIAS